MMLPRSSRRFSHEFLPIRQHGPFQMRRPRLQLLLHARFGNNSSSLRESPKSSQIHSRNQAILTYLEGGHLDNRHSNWERLESIVRAQDLENALHKEAPTQFDLP